MKGGGPWKTAPGQVTDDGELTLALGWALAEMSREAKGFDVETIGQWYLKWTQSKPFDIGNTTKKALCVTAPKGVRLLSSISRTIDPNLVRKSIAETMKSQAQKHNVNSLSNGALMRCTPMAVWFVVRRARFRRRRGADSALGRTGCQLRSWSWSASRTAR